MEQLQTVFDYIKAILEIIKNFFNELFPKQEEETEGENAEA